MERALRVLLVAAILLPLAALVSGVLIARDQAWREARRDLAATAAAVAEHAGRVFDSHALLIEHVQALLRGLSDEGIRAEESRLHRLLRARAEELPQVGAIWVFDRDGRALVNSLFDPSPRGQSYADRDYVAELRDGGMQGLHISRLMEARGRPDGRTPLFFGVTRAREAPAGDADPNGFAGVIHLSVYIDYFDSVFASLGATRAAGVALMRSDGEYLATRPALARRMPPAVPHSRFHGAIREQPVSGSYVRVGTNTGDERLFSYHRVGALPVYAMAAMPTAAILAAWTGTVLVHMAYALPACVALVLLALFALRQARRERAATEAAAAEAARAEAAETRLRHAQKLEALGSLTGGVAHDFNNLLTVVRGNAGLLRAVLPPEDARSRRRLEAILEAAERGRTLTRRLLAFARREPLRQETVDPAERLPALADTLRSALRGDIALAIEAPPGTWPVAVDPEELELALLNLATNARDAMPEGGQVRIAAANQRLGPGDPPGGLAGEFVRITVADTGAGIPSAALARVFEPFFTTKPMGAGTGLGLSQVYGFARQSGGGAAVESTEGRGTAVTLWLPRAAGGASPPRAAPDEAPAAPLPSRLRVLLAEDDGAVSETAAAMLGRLGFEVEVAPDGASALAALEAARGHYGLLVSDVMMPGGMSGVELGRQVRARWPDLPVLLASGRADGLAAVEAAGLVGLPKPFGPEELAAALHRLFPGAPPERAPEPAEAGA